jgi:hypothetical protein
VQVRACSAERAERLSISSGPVIVVSVFASA